MNYRYRAALTAASSLVLLGCQQYPEIADHGEVCVTVTTTDGQHSLVVEASSRDCAADHEGASFECSITDVGDRVQLETVFQDGKDPNGACAGPLTTTCTLDVEPGTFTLGSRASRSSSWCPATSGCACPAAAAGPTAEPGSEPMKKPRALLRLGLLLIC